MGKQRSRAGAGGPPRFERLLDFLSVFEGPAESAGGGRAGKVLRMPRLDYGREGRRLMEVLEEDGWILDFDWVAWQSRATQYYRHPEKLSRASLATLQRLLTVHARKDGRCEGHFTTMIRGGHVLEILRSVAALAPTTPSS